jgi:DNA-binding SARP family transcriptional activator
MCWCYLHAGRVDDMEQLLSVAQPGPDIDAVRYSMSVVRDQADPVPDRTIGRLTGGPLDALVMRTQFDRGRLAALSAVPASPWAAKTAESWQVSTLLSTGQTEQAFELYHQLVQDADHSVWLPALVGPRLMLEVGDHAEAWRLLREGRERIAATGSAMFEVYSLMVEAEFELRLNGDPDEALRILEVVADLPIGKTYVFLAEQRAMLAGRAHLASDQDQAAVVLLRDAVARMDAGGRILYLVPAAVYLAEAEWRTGNEDGADHAADMALAAAEQQGSNHYLLGALSEYPDVLARRIDAEAGDDGPWHVLGRALGVRGTGAFHGLGAAVELGEFGDITISVDGVQVSPGLNKSVELLAFLANRDREDVTRETLLDALFRGRRDEAAASYLRQAVLKLRKVLPDVLDDTAPPGVLRLGSHRKIRTESSRLIGLLGEAAAARGGARLAPLLVALEIADQGGYLPTIDSEWVEERRQRLDELLHSARLDAAEAACACGDYQLAQRLADQVVSADPYREAAWRLQMRLAHVFGDVDRVISAYRSCERALAELGTTPSSTTAGLLRDLQR